MSSANQYNLLNQMIGCNETNSDNNYNNYPVSYSGKKSGYSGQSTPNLSYVTNGRGIYPSNNNIGPIGGKR